MAGKKKSLTSGESRKAKAMSAATEPPMSAPPRPVSPGRQTPKSDFGGRPPATPTTPGN